MGYSRKNPKRREEVEEMEFPGVIKKIEWGNSSGQ